MVIELRRHPEHNLLASVVVASRIELPFIVENRFDDMNRFVECDSCNPLRMVFIVAKQ